jgi:hypothetical protein
MENAANNVLTLITMLCKVAGVITMMAMLIRDCRG